MKLAGPQGRSGPPGFELQTLQSVASRYVYYVVTCMSAYSKHICRVFAVFLISDNLLLFPVSIYQTKIKFTRWIIPWLEGSCKHGVARPQVADGGTAGNMGGSYEYIE